MVRRRSLRRRSIKKSLRSRRRSERSLRASYRFGAEEKDKDQSLISAFVEIVKINPRAAASILHLGVTTFFNECGIKEPGAIENKECAGNNVQATRELREFLNNWDPAKGPGPVPKSVKFGVVVPSYLLDMREAERAAKKKLAADRERQKKAKEAYKKEKEAYYNKLYNMDPMYLKT